MEVKQETPLVSVHCSHVHVVTGPWDSSMGEYLHDPQVGNPQSWLSQRAPSGRVSGLGDSHLHPRSGHGQVGRPARTPSFPTHFWSHRPMLRL